MRAFSDEEVDRLWEVAGVPPLVIAKFLDCVAQGLVNPELNHLKRVWYETYGGSVTELTYSM